MNDPNLLRVSISLLGGLAIFILGMNMMTQALNSLAGARLKDLLAAFTKNRFAAVISGVAITAAVQSSTVTTVLLVGFSSVGLISVAQSVGVIFGANVGSTVTAQIIAFNISEVGAPLLALGLLLHMMKKRERLSQFGLLLLGLGAIFFGMKEMGAATNPLRSYEPFLEAMQAIQAPAYGIAVGFVFTAIVQSSAATIGLAIVFASQGVLSLEGAIAIAFGANIGTCGTAVLAAIGRPTAAWRIVFIHVIFNVAGVVLWLAFIPQLAELSRFVATVLLHDPTTAREIAIAHTLFNVANLLLFIGFVHPIGRLAVRVVPERAKVQSSPADPIYLDPLYLNTPSMAIDRARLETSRLAALALRMSEDIPLAVLKGDASTLEALATRDDEIDALQTAIFNYLAKIDAASLSKKDQIAVNQVISLVNAWENIGDTLDNHVLALGHDRLDTGLEIGPQTRQALQKLHQTLLSHMRLALLVTSEQDPDAAAKLAATREPYDNLSEKVELALQGRLLGREPERMNLFRLELDLINNLKRLHYYLMRIAQLSLGSMEGQAPESPHPDPAP